MDIGSADPPYEHDFLADDCRGQNGTCYPDPNVPGLCFRAQTLNLAEILYNEAQGESRGSQALVGWTVRNRVYQEFNPPSCDHYPGQTGGTATPACVQALPCIDPYFCEDSKKYCCAMHGATTNLGDPQSQFNDEHVPFSTLYNEGFAYRAVHIQNGWIPDPSTGFVPAGVTGCNTGCTDPFCTTGSNITQPSPAGPMEFRSLDYCAEARSCKRYIGDFCGNTDSNGNGNPVEVIPDSACPPPSRGDRDNFFWNRRP